MAASNTLSVTKTNGPQSRTKLGKVIMAATTGSVFEWYDFYIYSALAPFFASAFFPHENPVTGFLASLALVGVGFFLRPVGAILFGWLGDMFGRKYTFLGTISLMGGSTALIGLLPTYAEIGIRAPAALLVLRVLQGLALGGEYGGSVIYVGEHSERSRRGFTISVIQCSGTIGFLLTLIVITLSNLLMDPVQFSTWGWRVPFLLSLALLGTSVYIRLHLPESPVFQELKATHQTTRRPIREGLLRWNNVRLILVALFGGSVGVAVVFYTNQLYLYYFLTSVLKVSTVQASLCLAVGILPTIPTYFLFGWLSDRIGRKPIFLAGCLLAGLTCFPIFHWIACNANPALDNAVKTSPVVLSTAEFRGTGDLVWSTFQDFFGRYRPSPQNEPSAEARAYLGRRGIPFSTTAAEPGAALTLHVGAKTTVGFNEADYNTILDAANYPESAAPANVRFVPLAFLIFLTALPVAMVLGPFGALILELFPARLRYTSLSIAYHLGVGWVGGCLPLVSTSLVVFTGNFYQGLWYPVFWIALTLLCGTFLLPNRRKGPGRKGPQAGKPTMI